jgi:undecaprenyl-diphosphatase
VAALVRGLRWIFRPVWRYVLGPAWRLVAPPLRFLAARLTPGGLGIELTTLAAVAAVSVYVIVLQVGLIEAGDLPTGDDWARDIARETRTGLATSLNEVLTFFGTLWVVVVAVLATCVALLARRRFLEAGALAAGLLATEITQLVLKDAVERVRPEGGLVEASSFAYPSGHAALAVSYLAIAIVVARMAPLTMRLALVIAGLVATVLIGLSRVYLEVHWLSDVLGGWAVGAASYSICGIVALVAAYVRLNWTGARAAAAAGRHRSA